VRVVAREPLQASVQTSETRIKPRQALGRMATEARVVARKPGGRSSLAGERPHSRQAGVTRLSSSSSSSPSGSPIDLLVFGGFALDLRRGYATSTTVGPRRPKDV